MFPGIQYANLLFQVYIRNLNFPLKKIRILGFLNLEFVKTVSIPNFKGKMDGMEEKMDKIKANMYCWTDIAVPNTYTLM